MIESIHLDPALCERYSLSPAHLSRLGELVAITGPNGAGKTRLLKLLVEQWKGIEHQLGNLAWVLDSGILTVPDDPGPSDIGERARLNLDRRIPSDGAITAEVITAQNEDRFAAKSGMAPGEAMQRLQAKRREEYDQLAATVQLRGGLSASLRRADWPKMVQISTNARHSHNDQTDRKNLRASALPAVSKAAHRRYMSHHPFWAERNPHVIAHAESFCRTVSEVLRVECGWAYGSGDHVVATFDGRPVEENELSEGQRIVLRWCEIIHDQVRDLHEAVILIDEPELHLHTALLLETLERLRALGPAQIIIATHSLSLLSYVGARNVFEMRNGHVRWAGNHILDVQRGLLGDHGVPRLRTFLSDAATLAFHQFAAECLVAPAPVPLRDPNDPQAQQLVSHVREALDAGVETHVLDFAAGSGRLVEALAAISPEQRTNLRYHAYCSKQHTSPEERAACRQQLARLHPDLDLATLYHEDLRERLLPSSTKMHAVVLCNVLHEITPSTWPSLMKDIHRCLRDDGTLVVLEDQRMTFGELPHDKGYLVLDEVELWALFDLDDKARRQVLFGWTYDDRLSMAQIPARFLERCTLATVRTTLESLCRRALDGVAKLRQPTTTTDAPEHHRGREHAYFAMLHTNATLALRELGG